MTRTPGLADRPRRYQLLAARAAAAALAGRDSTTIAMPWGAGKTWAGALAAERVARPARQSHTSSRTRATSTWRGAEWRKRTRRTVIAAFAPRGGEAEDRGSTRLRPALRGCEPRRARADAQQHPGRRGRMPYGSLALVCEAQRNHHVPRFAVALLDEVHRTASPAVVREEEIDWTPVHDRDYLAAAKRIGLSARPGAHPPTGPVAYRLTYEAAVRAGALPGYRVVVAVGPTGSRADALLEPIQSTLTASQELVLAPTAARDGVLSLIRHLRRSFSGPTTQLVLAALASPRPPREALAHAVRTEPRLRASFEALASVDDRFARALESARTARPARTALLTVLGTEACAMAMRWAWFTTKRRAARHDDEPP